MRFTQSGQAFGILRQVREPAQIVLQRDGFPLYPPVLDLEVDQLFLEDLPIRRVRRQKILDSRFLAGAQRLLEAVENTLRLRLRKNAAPRCAAMARRLHESSPRP